MIDLLCKLLLQQPHYAHELKTYFPSLLLPIVIKYLDGHADDDLKCFQQKFVALSILAEANQQVLR